MPKKFGLRGAAPWALRHAERQAEEAARRNREPPKPGSARATLRSPQEADRLKAAIGELHGQLQKLRTLQKNPNDYCFELGQLLAELEASKSYEAKGYASLETFVEREAAISKAVTQKLLRIPQIFRPEAAKRFHFDALSRALDALEPPSPVAANGDRIAKLPLKPPR